MSRLYSEQQQCVLLTRFSLSQNVYTRHQVHEAYQTDTRISSAPSIYRPLLRFLDCAGWLAGQTAFLLRHFASTDWIMAIFSDE